VRSNASSRVVDRSVVFVTPILLGSKNLPVSVASLKVNYKSSDLLNSLAVPAVVRTLEMPHDIINLPLENIDSYMKRNHEWLTLDEDA
jgi:hypothetical protein